MAASRVPMTFPEKVLRTVAGESKFLRELKKVDPRERCVLLFPDAEAAKIGMARPLLTIRPAERVFEEANELVKKDLLKLCIRGPKEELLGSIENRYLATFVNTHATIEKLRDSQPNQVERSKAVGCVGMGMINGLVFGGSMSFRNGLELVQILGKALDRASNVVPAAKIAVHTMPATNKTRLCRAPIEHCLNLGIPEEVAVCSLTKQKKAHWLEIAGHEEAIKWLETEGRDLFKLRKVLRLNPTGPALHTPLMEPVKKYIKAYIQQKIDGDIDYLKPPVTSSVYTTCSGRRVRLMKYVLKDLTTFMVRPILLEQLYHCMYDRPNSLAQPNTIALWDRSLLPALNEVNSRARSHARLFE